MIEFNYELDFKLSDELKYSKWIHDVVESYGFNLGELNYIFCDDAYLLKLNIEFLEHDTLTDIISFDYTLGKLVGGDVFISLERVKDNAKDFSCDLEEELKRVIIHGVLHFIGFKDKSDEEKSIIRNEENKSILLFK